MSAWKLICNLIAPPPLSRAESQAALLAAVKRDDFHAVAEALHAGASVRELFQHSNATGLASITAFARSPHMGRLLIIRYGATLRAADLVVALADKQFATSSTLLECAWTQCASGCDALRDGLLRAAVAFGNATVLESARRLGDVPGGDGRFSLALASALSASQSVSRMQYLDAEKAAWLRAAGVRITRWGGTLAPSEALHRGAVKLVDVELLSHAGFVASCGSFTGALALVARLGSGDAAFFTNVAGCRAWVRPLPQATSLAYAAEIVAAILDDIRDIEVAVGSAASLETLLSAALAAAFAQDSDGMDVGGDDSATSKPGNTGFNPQRLSAAATTSESTWHHARRGFTLPPVDLMPRQIVATGLLHRDLIVKLRRAVLRCTSRDGLMTADAILRAAETAGVLPVLCTAEVCGPGATTLLHMMLEAGVLPDDAAVRRVLQCGGRAIEQLLARDTLGNTPMHLAFGDTPAWWWEPHHRSFGYVSGVPSASSDAAGNADTVETCVVLLVAESTARLLCDDSTLTPYAGAVLFAVNNAGHTPLDVLAAEAQRPARSDIRTLRGTIVCNCLRALRSTLAKAAVLRREPLLRRRFINGRRWCSSGARHRHGSDRSDEINMSY